MAKKANPGEMRTEVFFMRVERTTNANGVPEESESNIFGQDPEGKDIPARGKWVNAHGTEVVMAMQLKLREPATFTTRYSPLYDVRLIAYKGGDPDPYEVISVNNVEGRNLWAEIKLQRREAAR